MGGVISPVLANMALDGLEGHLEEQFPRVRRHQRVHLVRYADDLIITGYSKEFLEDEVKPVVASFLAERGLELSEKKTVTTHIERCSRPSWRPNASRDFLPRRQLALRRPDRGPRQARPLQEVHSPVKHVYLYPLAPDFRSRLGVATS